MKRAGILAALLSCVLAGAGAGPASAATDEAAWLYAPDHVTQIEFELPEASRQALKEDPREYVEATFSLTRNDGTTYGPLVVGLKLKGHSSFRSLQKKAAFKLKFNEFVKGQTFLGLKKLTLNNMVQDRTMLHELLAYEAFRANGLAAPRTGYSFVRVDGEAFGVYLNVETLDAISLPRWYPTTQHLYEAEGGSRVDITPGAAARFGVDEGDDEDLTDLEALIDAVQTWQNLDAVADLPRLTRYWAVEKYIGHWDGYAGSHASNYYLHSDDDGRFTMLPWGTDQTWEARLDYGGPGGLMFNRCLEDPACHALYRAAVADVRKTLGALDLDGLASDTATLLRPWQKLDPRREHTAEQTRQGIQALHGFLATRASDSYGTDPADPADPAPPVDPPTDQPSPFEPGLPASLDPGPPDTLIVAGPPPAIRATGGNSNAAFYFTSERGSRFECRIAGREVEWATCTSPWERSDFKPGPHTVEVRAIDAAGVPDPTPATHTWRVVAAKLRARGLPRRCVRAKSFTVTVRVTDGLPVKRLQLEVDGKAIGHTARTSLKARIRAGRLGRGKHKLTILVTDTAGNTAVKTIGFRVC